MLLKDWGQLVLVLQVQHAPRPLGRAAAGDRGVPGTIGLKALPLREGLG